jgi:DNA-binding protein HU-beta
MVMNKDEMIAKISASTGISKKQASEAVQVFIDSVTTQLQEGKKVSFSGFGTFSVSHRKARMGRNPHTGVAMEIPASKLPVFKAGKNFKDAIKK